MSASPTGPPPIYVPVVHSVAAADLRRLAARWAWASATALLRAVAVLIITCPCALGLAVPAVQITASRPPVPARRAGEVRRGARAPGRGRPRGVRQDRRADRGRPAAAATPIRRTVASAAPLARASRHPLRQGPGAGGRPGAVAGRRAEKRRRRRRGVHRRPPRATWAAPASSAPTWRRCRETELWFGFEGETPGPLRFRRRAAAPTRPRRSGALKAAGPDRRGAVRRRRRRRGPRRRRPAGIERWRGGMPPAAEGRGHRRHQPPPAARR